MFRLRATTGVINIPHAKVEDPGSVVIVNNFNNCGKLSYDVLAKFN